MPTTSAPHADPDRLLTIGELARRSGLRASALRFYDREGVLVPASVDAVTGYRRYAAAQVRPARLLASLRRVGMPLAEVALVLDEDERGASGAAGDVVVAHEQRLVDGLVDARAEIRRTLALLAERGRGDGVGDRNRVRAGELAAAIGSVRFAVAPGEPTAGAPGGADLTVLTGMLIELCGAELRCIATDRYRLAVGWAPLVGAPAASVPVGAVVPAGWADRVADACRAVGPDDEVVVEVSEDGVGVVVDGQLVATPVLPGSFPDYRSIVAIDPQRPPVDADGLQALLPVEQESVGLVVGDDAVGLLVADGSGGDAVADLYVDPEFLHEALAVAGPRPTLVLDGPHRPLAIRGDGAGFSVLMPVAAPGSR
ncbi:DNA polymerase III subunit beta family protein [Humibacillus xanthopallidus]|uniref:DNA-binding transcriptional MerR regulator n=1 Tax=Humibacillus xanthopallidus TaxID=412689 RepID=A0A543HIS0_9MICO|nr:MerR family transcriptional regulator [Humibacillus xanthopallidus]TQM58197.1 DNA-binding transcriptional MerR regulator [Humibacillus xanthopallidus]